MIFKSGNDFNETGNENATLGVTLPVTQDVTLSVTQNVTVPVTHTVTHHGNPHGYWLLPPPGPLSRAGKEIVQSELGITQLIRGSDLSMWIPPSGVAEAGQDGAGGWILSSSLPNWVRGTQSHGEKAARGCCGWEMLGMR